MSSIIHLIFWFSKDEQILIKKFTALWFKRD